MLIVPVAAAAAAIVIMPAAISPDSQLRVARGSASRLTQAEEWVVYEQPVILPEESSQPDLKQHAENRNKIFRRLELQMEKVRK